MQGEAKAMNAGEIAKAWEADRLQGIKVYSCFHRLRCGVHETRKTIGNVAGERTCAAPKPKTKIQ